MTTATSPVASTGALGLNARGDPEVKKQVGFGSNGHEALDLAETAETSKQSAERLEAKRAANEKARTAQRARFEEQMRQLEADHMAEEAQIADGSPVNVNANGNTTSAPTTPPGRPNGAGGEKPAPIGQGREIANGAKSMPSSRRASGYGGTFGLDKLSLSVVEPKTWTDEEDVDAAGAQSSVQYLKMNDDDPFPGIPKSDKRLSTASAALDLAPLSQTPPRAHGSRPFDTAPKTSEWPQFGAQAKPSQDDSVLGAGRKNSPPGMADSITSLPAIPSKSVPGTPFGLSGGGAGGGRGGARRSGTSPNVSEGLSQSQRGFSNPDLARAFGKPQYGMEQPRPYGADPLYSMFDPNTGAPMGAGGHFNPHAPPYDPYGFEDDGYGSGALYPGGSMGLKNKRAETDREFNRFAGVRIEDLAGELLSLCKDQHGCRYLQKKLEEGDPAHRDMIFGETFGHFPELMTDPFGNYLCQKLLEFSTEEQRSAIIDSVAGDLVGISLNMHGTRAVQKMVDFLAQPRQAKQIRTLIYALSVNVVALIKDLNGNHVIQKCLNKLIPDDNQFIYNAIAANLIEVATHRHGCCVLQRSIDHASPAQRVQLVTEIIFNSLYLVQDPFGNYVIQYILDLNDARFSEPLIRTFIGNVCSLSVQKFSSNVVEKCIRVADPEIRKVLVGEVLNRSRLEKLLRDSYGNYVIQTILDYCDLNQRLVLIEAIRPILPSIRNTPYGKRIQSKLAREDSSFAIGGFGGGGGRGGFRGGAGGGGGGPGGYQRHLGRPQLQHINALTEVYGSQGPYMPPGGHFMPNAHGHNHGPGPHAGGAHHGGPSGPGAHGHHAQGPPHGGHGHAHGQFREMPTHTGVAYHAPGPDGQPWLHLRGPAGGPAPNWNLPEGGMSDGSGGLSAQVTGMTVPSVNEQVLPETAPAAHPGAAGVGAGAGWPQGDPNGFYGPMGGLQGGHGGHGHPHMM